MPLGAKDSELELPADLAQHVEADNKAFRKELEQWDLSHQDKATVDAATSGNDIVVTPLRPQKVSGGGPPPPPGNHSSCMRHRCLQLLGLWLWLVLPLLAAFAMRSTGGGRCVLANLHFEHGLAK